MQRVSRSSAVVALPAPPVGGTPGYFTGGNSNTGVPATVPGYEWFNAVQEELAYVIEQAGLALSGADNTLLRQAILKLITDAQKSVVVKNATFAAGVVAGNAVRWDSANARFDKAIADGTANNKAVGIADVANTNVICFGETPALLAGMTPGAAQYLSAATAGALTAVLPTDGVFMGIAKSATVLWVDIDQVGVRTDVANNFTKGQSGTVAALPSTTGTLAMDFTSANNFSGQVTGNVTFGNGYTGPGAGKALWFSIRVQQGAAVLYNWAFGTNWKYEGGSTAIPSQTQTLGAWDEILGQVLTDGTISFKIRSNVS